VDFFRNFW